MDVTAKANLTYAFRINSGLVANGTSSSPAPTSPPKWTAGQERSGRPDGRGQGQWPSRSPGTYLLRGATGRSTTNAPGVHLGDHRRRWAESPPATKRAAPSPGGRTRPAFPAHPATARAAIDHGSFLKKFRAPADQFPEGDEDPGVGVQKGPTSSISRRRHHYAMRTLRTGSSAMLTRAVASAVLALAAIGRRIASRQRHHCHPDGHDPEQHHRLDDRWQHPDPDACPRTSTAKFANTFVGVQFQATTSTAAATASCATNPSTSNAATATGTLRYISNTKVSIVVPDLTSLATSYVLVCAYNQAQAPAPSRRRPPSSARRTTSSRAPPRCASRPAAARSCRRRARRSAASS